METVPEDETTKDGEKSGSNGASHLSNHHKDSHNSAHADGHHDHHGHGDGGMPFYCPPVQRQRWGDKQLAPHTEWGDIFFDLFYVAAAYNLGNLLREDPSSRGLLYLVGCFLPIMNLWMGKMFYTSRFYFQDDMVHRLFEVATLVPLATAVLHIRTVPILSDVENNVDMFAFSLSITIGLVLGLVRSIEVMVCQAFWGDHSSVRLYPEAYYSARRDVIWGIAPLAFALAAAIYSGTQFYGHEDGYKDDAKSSTQTEDDAHRFLAGEVKSSSPLAEDDAPIWLCLASPLSSLCIMTFYIVFLFGKPSMDVKKYSVPMNVDYGIHRYGEWVMLLLGESVLSLLIVDLSEGYDYYKTFFSGVISVILLEFLHFRSQPHEPDHHALRRSRNAGWIFSLSMWVYSSALIVLGTSYKMFLYEFVYSDENEDKERRSLFPVSERILAAKTTALRFDTEDRQQRIAHFFSGSMALVWFCLDVTILAHSGLNESLERLKSAGKTKTQAVIVLLLAFRVGLIGFIASVSQYLTTPSTLAFLGMAGVLLQLILRVLVSLALPADEEEQEEEAFERVANHLNARLRSNRSSMFQ